jgi:hypothetical protein
VEHNFLQLQKIKDVCQKAQVDCTLIDGCLAASGVLKQFPQPHANPFQTVPDAFAASRVSETPFGVDNDNAQNNFQEFEETAAAQTIMLYNLAKTYTHKCVACDDANFVSHINA